MTLALVRNDGQAAPSFEDFWLLYPRRVAKKDARKAWDRMNSKDRVAALTALVEWRRVWAQKDTEFLPHPATWLNGERWTDELPETWGATHASHVPAAVGGTARERGEIPQHVRDVLAKLRK